MGIAASTNLPGARTNSATWIDPSGNVWIFGGYGMDAGGNSGPLNDLWEYSNDQWTWVSGSNFVNQIGNYGAKGVAAASNVPGARLNPYFWVDSGGALWLFGGVGYDANGARNVLNDLWKFDAGRWTWIGGSDTGGSFGVFGTMGTPSAGNTPSARQGNATWVDKQGDVWLFGGNGYDSTGAQGHLDDLWKYAGGEWTFVAGTDLAAQPAIYGTQGVAAMTNRPGGGYGQTTWVDPSGNLWMFGGFGSTVYPDQIKNDLWEYSGGVWTWMGGSDGLGEAGIYGVQGTPASGNVPGGRYSAVGWEDSSGNLWLFGGFGLDSTLTQGFLNDLWEYSNGQWTWINGSNVGTNSNTNTPSNYGTLGVASPTNQPSGRVALSSWTDPNGNFWLFGGYDAVFNTQVCGCTNDLWKLVP
jgi:N-acetylneuraminic acid mutarotase